MTRYIPYLAFYFHQGMLTTLALQGTVGYFRNEGMDLTQLSWLYIVMVPWIIKFMWAPWCERNALSFLKNNYLGSLALAQIAIVILLIIGSFIDPNKSIWIVISFLMLLMLLSSIHGIYANGILICSFEEKDRPNANIAQIGGGYFGVALGSYAFLAITQYTTWQIGFLFMAALSAILLLPIFLLRTNIVKNTSSKQPSFSLSCLKKIWPGILLSAIYYIAARGLMSLETVFLIDQGLSMAETGMIFTVNNTVLSSIGILLGGFIARNLKTWHCIITVMSLQAVIACIFVIGQSKFNVTGWIIMYAVFSVIAAVGFVTLYNTLMSMVRPHQPASDYTLFQSVDITIAMIMSIVAIRVAQYDYKTSFLLLAIISIISILTIILLRKKIFDYKKFKIN